MPPVPLLRSCLWLPLFSLSLPVAAQIAPGNLVVLRIGSGAAPLTNVATPVFLDEYTRQGTFVRSAPLPTTAAGGNRAFANSGTATSEGMLTQSIDGRFLVAAGYDAAPGTTGIASTPSATTARVVARIALDGTIDTSTGITDAFSGNNVRCAATDDGTGYWAVGANSGVVFAWHGATSGTSLNTQAPTNCRVVDAYDGQLYVTSGSGATRGVIAFGSGLPMTAGQVPWLLPGFPTATASPFDFFFADADTAYVADDRTSGGAGGIQKWTQSGGTWSLQYVLSVDPTTGARGLSGIVDAGVATLFATTTGNQLVAVTDTGPGAAVTVLASAAPDTALRGVRCVRHPYAIATIGNGSPTSVGTPTLAAANGRPQLGNAAFGFDVGNLVPSGFGFLALGLGDFVGPSSVAGAPSTVAIHVAPVASVLLLADGIGFAAQPFPLPPANAFAGLRLSAQVIAIDFALPDLVPIGASIGLGVTLGQ